MPRGLSGIPVIAMRRYVRSSYPSLVAGLREKAAGTVFSPEVLENAEADERPLGGPAAKLDLRACQLCTADSRCRKCCSSQLLVKKCHAGSGRVPVLPLPAPKSQAWAAPTPSHPQFVPPAVRKGVRRPLPGAAASNLRPRHRPPRQVPCSLVLCPAAPRTFRRRTTRFLQYLFAAGCAQRSSPSACFSSLTSVGISVVRRQFSAAGQHQVRHQKTTTRSRKPGLVICWRECVWLGPMGGGP